MALPNTPAVPTNVLGNFLALGSGEIAARLVAFFATTYLARTLGPDGFGVIGFALALAAYLGLAVRAGFDEVGARDVARSPTRATEIALGATLVRLVLATLAMGAIALVSLVLPKPPLVRLVVVLTGLSFFSLALDTAWVYKGLGRTTAVGLALVVGQVGYLGFVVATVHRPEDLAWVPLAQVGGELITAGLLLVPLIRRKVRPDFREGLAILRRSGFVLLTRLLRTMIYTFDMLLIALWLGERELGLYAAAYRFCNLLLAVAAAMQMAFLPAFARINDRSEYRLMAARSLRLSAVIAVPVVVGGSLIAAPLLALVFGASYAAGAAPFRLLLVSIGFIFLYGTIHNLLLALGRLRDGTRILAVAATANVGLNLLLIPRYGLVGAATATVIAEGLVILLGYGILARSGLRLPVSPVVPSLLAAGAMALVLQLAGAKGNLLVAIVLGAVVYTIILWAVRGIPPEIRDAVSRWSWPGQ